MVCMHGFGKERKRAGGQGGLSQEVQEKYSNVQEMRSNRLEATYVLYIELTTYLQERHPPTTTSPSRGGPRSSPALHRCTRDR